MHKTLEKDFFQAKGTCYLVRRYIHIIWHALVEITHFRQTLLS